MNTDTLTMPVVHLDPAHPAVAAILAIDVNEVSRTTDDLGTAVAALLRPLLADTPPLREWSEDDEYDAAERAVSVAHRLVVDVDRGRTAYAVKQLQNFCRAQRQHWDRLHLARLGEFEGFHLHVDLLDRIVVSAVGAVTEARIEEFRVPFDVTRRELQIATEAWTAGNEHGHYHAKRNFREAARELFGLHESTY